MLSGESALPPREEGLAVLEAISLRIEPYVKRPALIEKDRHPVVDVRQLLHFQTGLSHDDDVIPLLAWLWSIVDSFEVDGGDIQH